MRRAHVATAAALLGVIVSVSSLAQAAKPEDTAATRAQGQALFERACLFCHGVTGQGDGPAGWFLGRYASPRPQNFTVGSFKLRSTPSGDLPTDQDLFRTITKGIPGYMPGFASLPETARWQVVAYVKSFYPGFRTETPVPLSLVGAPTHQLAESLDRGRALYTSFECHTCHGIEGQGDGPVAQAGELKDAFGLSIPTANLTRPSSFKNGASLLDLVRTLLTGLDGTPMPSYAARLSDRETDAWDLAQYIRALSAESVP
ncbi:MAG: c-type cytochrome [Nitrospira sp. CG24E]|nr:MAG: c-type cytochrome [Nitrospira sp. CG24E]